ncbi:hypothetical protein [Flexivirga oryzae]|uniref:Uncharacterized protein n=1 Tax=Flexivirga oryzae TaxID=1794944 RepID=A0A839ND61_9MICO|nr:hypothetical protein [Flexivirga oryzae]MBB2893566.1 hypothetical protein [Flexivirga oryzae]
MSIFDRLLDDAAVFPPGNLPLAEAVPAHGRHEHAPYAGVVGAFVLAARDLDALAACTASLPPGSLPLSMTVPLAGVGAALARAAAIPAVRLVGLEVALGGGDAASAVVGALSGVPDDLEVYVELPRDARRDAVAAVLSGTRLRAKLRTGGVRAELYPDEAELAETIASVTRNGLSFKATAGLHHALRNTDPDTGFEQHGFLNVLLAADAAHREASVDEIAGLLAQRDPAVVASGIQELGPGVRQTFRSFGTCSVADPVDELVDLGLLPESHRTRTQETA